jgi:ornithine cyclodeaminase
MTRYLTDADVSELADMRLAIDAVETALIAKVGGEALNEPRTRVPLASGSYNVMSAVWPTRGIAGLKTYAVTPGGLSLIVLIFGLDGDGLRAIIEAGQLTRLRTGAASGVAAKWLAPAGGHAAIIGTGGQAEQQLRALVTGAGITSAAVYSRDVAKRTDFALRMEGALNIRVTAADSAEECVRDASVVVTITSSATPVLKREWLAADVTVIGAGSNTWARAELDAETVSAFELVAVDDIDQARADAGDLVQANDKGLFPWARAVELGTICARGDSWVRPSGAALFESQGIALEDLALAERILDRADAGNVGIRLPERGGTMAAPAALVEGR